MDSLDALAGREAELYVAVERAVGLMEDQERALAAAGVFAAYGEVLRGYVRLLGRPGAAPEALKRAAFLVWYEVAEPACFSGVRDLPEDAVHAALAGLDAAAAGGAIDAELAAMLGYYWTLADYAFARGGPWSALGPALAASDPDAWRANVPAPTEPWARGQMSAYWAGVSRVT
jgi:hypothetical protein